MLQSGSGCVGGDAGNVRSEVAGTVGRDVVADLEPVGRDRDGDAGGDPLRVVRRSPAGAWCYMPSPTPAVACPEGAVGDQGGGYLWSLTR